MRRVLIVSPNWPPVALPDMHRARAIARYSTEFGWSTHILTVEPEHNPAPKDESLALALPTGLAVTRVRALPLRLTKLVGVGSVALRSLPQLNRAGKRLLASGEYDLAFFSTTAFTLFTLGPRWRRQFGVPFVLDYQDPWVNATPRGQRTEFQKSFKYRINQRLARLLEPRVIAKSAGIVSVSPQYCAEVANRYPRANARCIVLPFAPSDEDFAAARRSAQSVFDPSDGKLHWVFTGRLSEGLHFSAEALCCAVALAIENDRSLRERLRVHFVGTSYSSDERQLGDLADKYKLDGVLVEHPRRVAYFESIKCLLDASGIIVLGSTESGYSPSKLRSCLRAGKPVIAIMHEKSPDAAVLTQNGVREFIAYSPDEPVAAVADRIRALYLSGGQPVITPQLEPGDYDARMMTKMVCQYWDELIDSRA
jgi:hypothetical protein